MIKSIVLFVFAWVWLIGNACGQDSTGIIALQQEMGEVRRQRFIDRYENVFMTKEPTRHILKVGFMAYNGWTGGDHYLHYSGNNSISAGYEYKITPAFSIGVGGFFAGGLASRAGEQGLRFIGSTGLSVQSRWYYEMKKRIENGYSASNFSGNYLGLTYDRYTNWSSGVGRSVFSRLGVEWGMQRRFFNYGFIDFGAGLYYQFDGQLRTDMPGTEIPENISMKGDRLGISSKATIGLALGDWKKKTGLPFCEVLRCQEVVRSQFTISWPEFHLGLHNQSLAGGLGFEQKLFGSISAKARIDGFVLNQSYRTGAMAGSLSAAEAISAVQLRYYVFQRKLRKTGRGGYDLNGFYVGPLAEHSIFRSHSALQDSEAKTVGTINALRTGIVAGYQRTLFKNAYIDIDWRLTRNLSVNKPGYQRPLSQFRISFGLRF